MWGDAVAIKKSGRASWFKVFLHQKALIDAVPDENAGAALKAAFSYFDTGEAPESLDPLTLAVFASLKPYIDEAFSDYQATSEKNRQNIQKRWNNQGIRDDTSGNHSLPSDTEAEAETEAETEAEGETETKALSRSLNPQITANLQPQQNLAEPAALGVHVSADGRRTADSTVSAERAPSKEQKKEFDFNDRRRQAMKMLEAYPGK